MSFRHKILFVLPLLFIGVSFAQSRLTYNERTLFLSSDTLQKSAVNLAASEGILNGKDYMVGPGDSFIVSIIGVEEFTQPCKVDLEGSLYIPKVGVVSLIHLNLEDAKMKIKTFIENKFRNVDIYITLTAPRLIKVGLYGDVKKPQSFAVLSTTRLSDLFALSNGISPTSDLRNIKLISRDGSVRYCDLIKFFRLNNSNENPFLTDGVTIYVDRSDQTITASGLIKYPGVYEVVKNETLYSFIELCGGVLEKGRTDSIEVISYAPDRIQQYSKFYSLQELKNSNILLRGGDRVIVRQIPEIYTDNIVYIDGFVKYPGPYRIVDGVTKLSEVIAFAGGFRKEASLADASLKREIGADLLDPEYDRLKLIPRQDMTDDEYDYFKSHSRLKRGVVIVDFRALFDSLKKSEDITLRRMDQITVPEKRDYIIMLGQVVASGNIPFQKGLKIEDYIKLAGGYAWRAIKSDVRVIRANTGEWVDADEVVELQPGDAIWVPEDPPGPKFWVTFKDILTVFGQISAVVAATVAVIVSVRK